MHRGLDSQPSTSTQRNATPLVNNSAENLPSISTKFIKEESREHRHRWDATTVSQSISSETKNGESSEASPKKKKRRQNTKNATIEKTPTHPRRCDQKPTPASRRQKTANQKELRRCSRLGGMQASVLDVQTGTPATVSIAWECVSRPETDQSKDKSCNCLSWRKSG